MRSIFSLRSWLLALLLAIVPASSFAGVFLSINIAPPVLPIYEQPLCPGEGYIWTPGYWAYGEDGYFWVPGTWVVAPFVGGLWTPGYWGWGNGFYMWNEGYWGRHIGFYGGVNYGYGYGGRGYEGGYWRGDRFNYNRTVNNINVSNVHNVYNKTVINNYNDNRVSYNGGNGGVAARPGRQEQVALRERHTQPLPVQQQHVEAARSNRQQWASVNHGVPAVAATPRPGAFNDRGAVPAANRPVNGNFAAPGRNAQQHDGTQSTVNPRGGGQANVPQRNTNPSGNGTAPLITAHPNHEAAPVNQARPGQPANNNQNGRPAYNVPQQRQQNVPQARQQDPRYNAPQQHQQSAPQDPRYNAQQQQQQRQSAAQQQQRQSAPQQQQQRQSAPQQQQQRQSAPQPQQQRQSAPQQQQQRQSAPQQQQQRQSAPQSRGGGEPRGGEGHPR